MRRQPSVTLIRESEEQLSGSGCWGRLEGDFLVCGGERVFPERRAIMNAMGPVYRTLRTTFGEAVEVQVGGSSEPVQPDLPFDPRLLGLPVGLVEALQTLCRLPVQAVVVNGRLVARGEWPHPMEVVGILDEAISEASRQPA